MLSYDFMRLVHRANNPNKETIIYTHTPYTLCHHRLSVYNPSCPQNNKIREQRKHVYYYPCT